MRRDMCSSDDGAADCDDDVAARPPAVAHQTVGFVIFVLIIAVSALIYGLLDPAASQLFATASSQTSSQAAQDIVAERQRIWERVLFIPLFLGGLVLLSRAVLLSRRP